MTRLAKTLLTGLSIALGHVAFSTPAQAAFAVKATLNSTAAGSIGGGGVFQWTVNSYGTVDNGTGLGQFNDSDYHVGSAPPMDYTPINFPGFSGGTFNTFCIEVNEHINYGGTYIYELTHNIAGTPNDNGGAQPNGMGAVAATNLRLLFGKYFSGLSTAATEEDKANNYKAFQLAIWEIVQDSGSSYNLASGNFSFGSSAARTLATGWLADLGTVQAYNLVVLTRDGRQDQIGMVATPAPPALVLAICGIVPCLALRRRLFGTRSPQNA